MNREQRRTYIILVFFNIYNISSMWMLSWICECCLEYVNLVLNMWMLTQVCERCLISNERCLKSNERCLKSNERCLKSNERCLKSNERCLILNEPCIKSMNISVVFIIFLYFISQTCWEEWRIKKTKNSIQRYDEYANEKW